MESEDKESIKEELIDILEVVYSIASVNNISKEDLEKDRQYKESIRGSFNNRLIIEEVRE